MIATAMKGRRSGTARAALLAGGLALLLEPPVHAEPPCIPVVRVSGEPALAAPVIALLRRRGVAVDGTSKCGTLTAVLTGSDERTRITIVDPDGRTVQRVADDVKGAATAIESWARRDVSAPLLAAREAPPSSGQSPDREDPVPIETAAVVETRPIEIAAAGEVGWSSDGAVWTGAHAQACVTVDVLCAGALVRYAGDTKSSGDSVLRGTSRRALDMLLTADLPLRLGRSGRFALSPGAGAGMTWLHARRDSGEREKVEIAGLHLRARLGAGVRIAGAWSLQADVALGYAPFSPATLREVQFGGDDDEGPDDAPPLAGFPRAHGWFGLGLVYGGL
jgi:hypothetical protein